jgi:hypothetical protein
MEEKESFVLSVLPRDIKFAADMINLKVGNQFVNGWILIEKKNKIGFRAKNKQGEKLPNF